MLSSHGSSNLTLPLIGNLGKIFWVINFMLWKRFPIIGMASYGTNWGSSRFLVTSGPISVIIVGRSSIESEYVRASIFSGRWAIPIRHTKPTLYVLFPRFSPTKTLTLSVATRYSICKSNQIRSAFGRSIRTFNLLLICSGNASILS